MIITRDLEGHRTIILLGSTRHYSRLLMKYPLIYTQNAEDVLIDNQGLAGEQYRNFEKVAAVPLGAHHVSAVKTEETLVSEEESTAPSQSLSIKEVQISSFQRRGMNLKPSKRRGKKPTKIQKKQQQQLKKRKKTSIGSGATTSGLWRSERVKKPKILDQGYRYFQRFWIAFYVDEINCLCDLQYR